MIFCRIIPISFTFNLDIICFSGGENKISVIFICPVCIVNRIRPGIGTNRPDSGFCHGEFVIIDIIPVGKSQSGKTQTPRKFAQIGSAFKQIIAFITVGNDLSETQFIFCRPAAIQYLNVIISGGKFTNVKITYRFEAVCADNIFTTCPQITVSIVIFSTAADLPDTVFSNSEFIIIDIF